MSYEKQTWKNGDVITADKLNYMENGIAERNIIVATPGIIGNETNPLGITIQSLDKTWQEIYDSDLCIVPVIIEQEGVEAKIWAKVDQVMVYSSDGATYYLVQIKVDSVVYDLFATSSNGYPTHSEENGEYEELPSPSNPTM